MLKVRQIVYDTYWLTAAERQEIFFKRMMGYGVPYTSDPIFQKYKFCNLYRASDRVSQFLIKNVIYKEKYNPEDIIFRTFLFRLLNKIETWIELENKLGDVSLKNFSFNLYDKLLSKIKLERKIIYGNAFILCANKAYGFENKHQNHLALLDSISKNGTLKKIAKSKSLKSLFNTLRDLPLIGNFMAYQIAIDFNYSEVFNFNENDFTIAGPGAVRGINKCFMNTNGKDSSYIIKYMVENQDKEFQRLGVKFKDLFTRPLHAIDCQNWFCETDKYTRVKFPELKTNRTKIKAKFKPSPKPISYFYPPKWELRVKF